MSLFGRGQPKPREANRAPPRGDYMYGENGVLHKLEDQLDDFRTNPIRVQPPEPLYEPDERKVEEKFKPAKMRTQPRDPLDDLAALVGGLLYEKMVELAKTLVEMAPKDKAMDSGEVANLLHIWSKSREKGEPNV